MSDYPTNQLPADLFGFPLIVVDPYLEWHYVFKDANDNLYCTIKVYAARHGAQVVDFTVVVEDQWGYESYRKNDIRPSSIQAAIRAAGGEVLLDLRERYANAGAVLRMLETIEQRLNPEEPAPTLWERLG